MTRAASLIEASNAGRLGLHLLKNPAGTWSFVGSVPLDLRYARRDGQPMDDETARGIRAHGPGFYRATVLTRTWPTRDAAYDEATGRGYTVQP